MKNIIQKNAYRQLGKEASFYDGMMTCSTVLGTAVSKLVWSIGKEKNEAYIEKALSGIPADFAGKLLEVPVGTGALTVPVYKTLPKADITCLDYSESMMAAAQKKQRGWVFTTLPSSREMWASCPSQMRDLISYSP